MELSIGMNGKDLERKEGSWTVSNTLFHVIIGYWDGVSRGRWKFYPFKHYFINAVLFFLIFLIIIMIDNVDAVVIFWVPTWIQRSVSYGGARIVCTT